MALATRSRQTERGKRRAEIRDSLLDAASSLFADGLGYGEISVDRLSSAAGLTRTTFYVYFESKADLLIAWLEDAAAEIGDAGAEWWSLDTAPSREQLQDLVAGMLGRY